MSDVRASILVAAPRQTLESIVAVISSLFITFVADTTWKTLAGTATESRLRTVLIIFARTAHEFAHFSLL